MPVEKADADPRCWRIDTIYKKVLNDRSKHVGQVAYGNQKQPSPFMFVDLHRQEQSASLSKTKARFSS